MENQIMNNQNDNSPIANPQITNNNPDDQEAFKLNKTSNNYESNSPTSTKDQDLYTEEEMKKFKIRGILHLIGGMLIHLELGTFYVFGSISPYIGAYLREYDSNVTMDFMSIIFPILGLITMSLISFGLKIAEKIGFKITIFAGSMLVALAFLIISFVKNIWGFVIIYCLLVGVPGGLTYMLPIVCGWRYFPNNRGLVSGLIVGAYGFGSFIFNFICKAIANPDTKKPTIEVIEGGTKVKYFDHTVAENVPLMLQVLAACYFGLAILGTLLVSFPADIDPDKYAATLKSKEDKKTETKQFTIKPTVVSQDCPSMTRGVKSIYFAILIPLVLFSITLGMLISNCYKFYGLDLEIDDATLTITGSVAGVMNGSSRFFWATLMDKTSFKFTFTLISIINLLTAAILPYNRNGTGYVLLIALVYLAEGGLLGTYPVVCYKIFGKTVGALMYGYMFFMIGVANMLGYVLYAYARKNGFGWEGVFWFCFALNILGIVLGLILKENGVVWNDEVKPTKVNNQDIEDPQLENQ